MAQPADAQQQADDGLETLDRVALYDIMYETGTRLIGRYSWLMDHEPQRHQEWRDGTMAVTRRRRRVDPEDRPELLGCIQDWRAEVERLAPSCPRTPSVGLLPRKPPS